MSLFGYTKAFFDVVPFRFFSEKTQKKIISKRQREIIEFARKNTKFYASKIPENWEKITDITPTQKADFMAHFNDTLTDPEINYDMVIEQMHKIPADGNLLGKYYIASSSGSSGNPLISIQDRTAADRDTLASTFRNSMRFPCVTVTCPQAFALSTERIRKNQRDSAIIKKIVATINSMDPALKQAQDLAKIKAKYVFGYSSAITLIADAAWENDIYFNTVKRVYLSGEPYGEFEIGKIKRAFPNARVLGIYGCTEGGAMAYECKYGHMHINSDLVLLEAVDKDLNPVPYDTPSEQTLITNYSNKVQPLVRFVLGDSITLHHGCKCGLKDDWVEVQGRANDILPFESSDGQTVYCSAISMLLCMEDASMHGLENFREYQVVLHEPNTLEIRLDCYKPEEKEKLFENVKKIISDYLATLSVTNVNIYLSDKLPQATTASGKRKRIYIEK